LPVSGNYELSAVQELSSIQKSPGKIGAIEHRFEKVRGVQMRTRQIRPTQVRAPEIIECPFESRHMAPKRLRCVRFWKFE
jgi:hypothetical protein